MLFFPGPKSSIRQEPSVCYFFKISCKLEFSFKKELNPLTIWGPKEKKRGCQNDEIMSD